MRVKLNSVEQVFKAVLVVFLSLFASSAIADKAV